MTIDYIRRAERLLLHRDVTPNAYQKGFEDGRYGCVLGIVYRNPFPFRSYEWHDYDRGFADAMRARRLEKI